MHIDIYFKPLDLSKYSIVKDSLGAQIEKFALETDFPSLKKTQIALIGVNEDRASKQNKGSALGCNHIRRSLYKLYANFDQPFNIVDLGNINAGKTIEDTYFALTEVTEYLIQNNIIPIVLGSTQDLTYPMYLAYSKQNKIMNIVSIDRKFDIDDNDKKISSDNFMNKIILHQPNVLFNYSNLGFQSYFESQSNIDLMSKLHFDMHRLGQIGKELLKETEPTMRNADLVSFDISAVRASDAPACKANSPNGLYAEEYCQLAWYAGLSDKVSSIGFFEYNPTLDIQERTAGLQAQAVWYFIKGFYNRKNEEPSINTDDFLKFRVIVEEDAHEIVFYKSTKSNRWWMNVPYPEEGEHKYASQNLVPCSYEDYKRACNEDIPDRWWKTFQKLL